MARLKFYSTTEVAEIFGVTRRTVYTWIAEGRLGAIKAGPKLWKVSEADLQRFATANARANFAAMLNLAVEQRIAAGLGPVIALPGGGTVRLGSPEHRAWQKGQAQEVAAPPAAPLAKPVEPEPEAPPQPVGNKNRPKPKGRRR